MVGAKKFLTQVIDPEFDDLLLLIISLLMMSCSGPCYAGYIALRVSSSGGLFFYSTLILFICNVFSQLFSYLHGTNSLLTIQFRNIDPLTSFPVLSAQGARLV